MFEEINVKIDSLENLVKGAIDGMLEEKENKFVPTVINYGEVSINE